MCELLAIAFNRPVTANLSFRGFRHRSRHNPHGWGLAYFQDNAAQIIKEPVKAERSALAGFLKDYAMISPVFMGHVRFASVGEHTLRNCHPFGREVNGGDLVFMHNGTLRDDYRMAFPLGRFQPLGNTDSEYAFCALLGGLLRDGMNLSTLAGYAWLSKACAELNRYGDFNTILSDGQRVYCYHDCRGYNGLCYVHREPPYPVVTLTDEDWTVDLRQEKDQQQRGYVVASHPLTDETWTSFEPGELIVLERGEMVYSNQRQVER